MGQRFFLAATGAAAVLILVASFWDHPAAAAILAIPAAAFPVLLMAAGALRRGRLGAVAIVLFVLFVLLEGSFVALLLLRDHVTDGPWLFGLPLALVVLLGGVFVVPLAVTALGYGLTFRHFGVAAADLARLREIARPDDD